MTNPNSEAAKRAELTWDAYYERFDTPELHSLLIDALKDQFQWDPLDMLYDRSRAYAAVAAFVAKLPSSACLALARTICDAPIPTFESWNEERP